MRVHIIGKVVEVKDRSYTGQDGQTKTSKRVFVRQDGAGERFGADYVDAPSDAPVKVGERVCIVANVTARQSVPTPSKPQIESYLSRWCVEVLEAPKLAAA